MLTLGTTRALLANLPRRRDLAPRVRIASATCCRTSHTRSQLTSHINLYDRCLDQSLRKLAEELSTWPYWTLLLWSTA